MEKAKFYLIYPPGPMHLAKDELIFANETHFSDAPFTILEIEDGGILIEAQNHQGFMLNNILKTPTRILKRLAEFRAKDFPKLYNKTLALNWHEHLIGQIPNVEVSGHDSKLFDSRKVEKAITDAINEYYRRSPIKEKFKKHLELNKDKYIGSLYFRVINDDVTLSLDTSGEPLYKRGNKIYSGNASIRENIAAILLRALTKDIKVENATLIDPMCGSGTFLLEGLSFFEINHSRFFDYEIYPSWIYSSIDQKKRRELRSFPSFFNEFIGIERDSEVFKQTLLNTESKKEINIINMSFQDAIIDLKNDDRFIIVNPPYGIRVGQEDKINAAYFQKLIDQLFLKFSPKRVGIIIPDEHNVKIKGARIIEKLKFKNGGIAVSFYVLEAQKQS